MVEKTTNDGNSSSRTTRRSVIGGLVTASLIPTTTLASKGHEPSVSVITGSYDDPVAIEQVERVQKRKIKEHQTNGSGREKRIITSPKSSGRLIGYTSVIDENGVLRQKFDFAGDRSSESRAKNEAIEKSRVLESQLGEFTTENVSSQNDSWSTIEDSEIEDHNSFGDLVNYYEWARDNPMYVYRERFSMTPKGDYENHEGTSSWDWERPMDLKDWEPFGGSDGSVSRGVELSHSGFTFGYTYETKDVEVKDTIDDEDDIVGWHVSFDGSSARETTNGFEPSTMAEADGIDHPNTLLLSVESRGMFMEDTSWGVPDLEEAITSADFGMFGN